ncbi:MAG TPA: response regulator [Niastella sp.]
MSEPNFIMLIDDDIDDRFMFSRTVKQEKPEIKCITAEGGKEAFDLLNNMQELPQVIFLDINMPGMSGWEFLQQIKKFERLKNIPVLIYSTSSHDKDIEAAQTSGAIGYCVKPLDFEGLKTIIKFVGSNLGPGLSNAIKANRNITYFQRFAHHI